MVKRFKPRRMDIGIQEIIEAQLALGRSPKQIFDYINNMVEKENEENKKKGITIKPRSVPSTKTIERMRDEFFAIDKSGIWSIDCDDPQDARFVLDILADGIANEYAFSFTKDQTKWLIRLRKAAPDAPSRVIFFLAFVCMNFDGENEINAINGYLAHTPWKKDRTCMRLYKRAVLKKWVPKIPFWSILVEAFVKPEHIDPRFTENADVVSNFENNIYERSKRGKPEDAIEVISNLYDIHPLDVEDIIKKYEEGD